MNSEKELSRNRIGLAALCLLAVLTSGCLTYNLKDGAAPQLKPGEGLVGIQVDALDKISQLSFTSREGGPTLYTRGVVPGITTHLFQAPAGTYCLNQFHFGDWKITFDGDLCFDVQAGELGYGGRFAPRVVRGNVEMQHSTHSLEHFQRALRQKFPAVATAYLRGD